MARKNQKIKTPKKKLTANQIAFNKQSSRLAKALSKAGYPTLELKKPSRITKSYLDKISKIKPKHLKDNLSRFSEYFEVSEKKQARLDKATLKDKKQTYSAQPNYEKWGAYIVSETGSVIDPDTGEILSNSKEEFEAQKEFSSYTIVDGYFVDDLGNRIAKVPTPKSPDSPYNPEPIVQLTEQWEINKRRFNESIDIESRGASIVSQRLKNCIYLYGEEAVYQKMSTFGRDFWDALTVVAHYNEDFGDDGLYVSYDEYSENMDLIRNYLNESFSY